MMRTGKENEVKSETFTEMYVWKGVFVKLNRSKSVQESNVEAGETDLMTVNCVDCIGFLSRPLAHPKKKCLVTAMKGVLLILESGFPFAGPTPSAHINKSGAWS